jgi:hypothetical protein
MKEDSDVEMTTVKTAQEEEGPCGGALEQKKRNFRRLKSKETGKIIHQKKEKNKVQKVFDPTAWYVVQTKRYKEVISRDFLNSTQGFVNDSTNEPYTVEAYAAIQEDEDNRVVIHGKIFIRVDVVHRVDVLKKCSYLKGYVKDLALSRTEHDFTDFARVPDREIKALRAILEIADGDVEYSEEPFSVNDTVMFKKGILSKSEALKDMKGSIEMVNGKKRATIILDKLGVFKFNIPVSQLRKM